MEKIFISKKLSFKKSMIISLVQALIFTPFFLTFFCLVDQGKVVLDEFYVFIIGLFLGRLIMQFIECKINNNSGFYIDNELIVFTKKDKDIKRFNLSDMKKISINRVFGYPKYVRVDIDIYNKSKHNVRSITIDKDEINSFIELLKFEAKKINQDNETKVVSFVNLKYDIHLLIFQIVYCLALVMLVGKNLYFILVYSIFFIIYLGYLINIKKYYISESINV